MLQVLYPAANCLGLLPLALAGQRNSSVTNAWVWWHGLIGTPHHRPADPVPADTDPPDAVDVPRRVNSLISSHSNDNPTLIPPTLVLRLFQLFIQSCGIICLYF